MEEKPKPKRKRRSKKEDEFTSEEVKELLKEVMDEIELEDEAKKEIIVESLISVLSEYMRSFIVIGYDVSSIPVQIVHAKSQLDADALHTSLSRFVYNTMRGEDNEPS